MTKRMIDADALLDWIEVQSKKNYAKTFNSFFTSADFIKQEITRLKSLASVVTEPQESIFDADGWCEDFEMSKIHHKILIVTSGNDIIIASPQSRNSTWIKWQLLPNI